MNQGVSRHPVPRRSRGASDVSAMSPRREYEEATYNELWRTVPRSALQKAPPDPEAREAAEGKRRARPAAGEPALFPGEACPEAGGVAARDPAHRAHAGAVLLSPAPDQGDERGLRHVLPLRDHEPHVRQGAASPKARCWSSCTRTPRSCSNRGSTIASIPASIPMRLGFAMMRDIQRISVEPTEEDRDWFPEFAGNGDPLGNLKEAWANFRDDSFIHAVPVAKADPRLPPVPDPRQLEVAVRRGQGHP